MPGVVPAARSSKGAVDRGVDVVRHTVFSGALPAKVVAHDIVRTRRQDLLTWFQMSDNMHPGVRGDVDEIATVTVSPGMRGRKEASHGASEL